MKCKRCGNEVDKKAVVCPGCGCKIQTPIYKKIWFWAVLVVVAIIVGSSGGNETTPGNDAANETVASGDVVTETASDKDAGEKETPAEKKDTVEYESVDLQTMFDDLDGNAMKAESKYQKKNIEFKCKISSFDSDGTYISVEPVGASEWNFKTAMCYIKNKTQKEFLMEKNVGDTITIKGQVKSIGEVMGYSININEVQ